MLLPRIIPCLLVRNKGLDKTVNFGNERYIGDPINAVRIFNEKEADELILLDIDASGESREPDYRMIERLARECRMPFCYGGGIRSVEQAKRILGLGVEKVSVSSKIVDDPNFVSELAACIGNQSVVTILDIRGNESTNSYEVWTINGRRRSGRDPFEFARQLEQLGAGEIVLNSIDRDGAMQGYDVELAKKMRSVVNVPLTFLGGAGSLQDIQQLIDAVGTVGAAAGSLFVYQGIYKAVLIRYPTGSEKDSIVGSQQQIRG